MARRCSMWLAAVAFVALAAPSDAALIVYFDKGTFLADTGATSATGALPNVGNAGATEPVGDVMFTTLSGSLFFGTAGTGVTEWSTLIPGNDLAISGSESFRIDLLAGPAFSLGFDFVEPVGTQATDGCNAACHDTTFMVTLLSGGVAIPGASFNFNVPDATLAFVGVWTDFAFDGARIIDVTDTNDNEFFGQFYTGTEPVPEPGTLLLLGGGLIGLASRRRRSR